MVRTTRHKILIKGTIAPSLRKWVNDRVEEGYYNSDSDAVQTALIEARYRWEENSKKRTIAQGELIP